MYLPFFLFSLGLFLTLPLHAFSVEHKKLQERLGRERGRRIGRILAVFVNLFQLLFLIFFWFFPQPRFTFAPLPIFFIFGLTVYLSNFFLSLPFLILGFYFLLDSEKRLGEETLMGHLTPKKIITVGSYGLVRHPQYLGSNLFHLGMSILLGGEFALFASPLYFLYNFLLAKREEEALILEIGKDYKKYQKNVPMFIPRLKNKKMEELIFVWLAVFLFWSIYRVFFSFPEWVDELITKPIVFLGPLIFILKKEKKDFSSIGLTRGNFFADLYLGIFLGFLFALEGLAANYLKYGNFSFAPILNLKGGGIFLYLLLSLATSFSEEILGRGFFFKRIYKIWGSLLKGAFFSSLLFLSFHLPIAFKNLSGLSLAINLGSVFILGVLNSLIFNLRKTLTLPILIHCFWNMTVALYL